MMAANCALELAVSSLIRTFGPPSPASGRREYGAAKGRGSWAGGQKITAEQEAFVKSLRDLHRALQFAAKAQFCAPLFTGAGDSMAATISGGYMSIIAFTLLAVTVVFLSLIGQSEYSA